MTSADAAGPAPAGPAPVRPVSTAAPTHGPVPATLRVLGRAEWPERDDDTLAPIAGFIVSPFNPLVAEVADRCLRDAHGSPASADPGRRARTGVVLASVGGDRGTAHALGEAVATGRRVQPLLFFQSNPNAVVGHITARWALEGPVTCIRPAQPGAAALADALGTADLMLLDGGADEVLVIAAESGRTAEEPGSAVALLVERAA
jgi:hypothetical protein